MKKMRKRKAFLATSLATTSAALSVVPTKAQASVDPYTYTYVVFGIAFCHKSTGVMTQAQSFQMIDRLLRGQGITPGQEYLYMNRRTFQADAKGYIRRKGGCRGLLADFNRPSGTTRTTGYTRGTLSDTPFEF